VRPPQATVHNFKSQISNFKYLQATVHNFKSQISNLKFLTAGLPAAALFVSTMPAFAQAPSQPYAVLPHDAVNYSGPGRDAAHDLKGSEIKIGFLAPLTGPHQTDGKALLEAAQMAIEDEAATPVPEGQRMAIIPRDQSGPWGRASSEIVQFIYNDQAVAIITSLDGASAHLAEQVANKVGIPLVTLSSDPTTTQINLPWIFRLGLTDTQQARAFARDIYVARKLKKAIILTEDDHDGRVGGEEFQKAARGLTAPSAFQLAIDPADAKLDSVIAQVIAGKPEALVFWMEYDFAVRLVAMLRKSLPATPIYLCHRAAQGSFDTGNLWTVTPSLARGRLRESFEKRYRARTGTVPVPAAAQAYDAVRILAAAVRRSGSNRARLRDALAGLSCYSGVSGAVAFDHAGNDVSDVTLVRFP
jgi:branched-chain amino acid transport system substrate-binding protein